MGLIFDFPDGEIEMRSADAYGGPDNCFSKLNVNSTANFLRKNGRRWHRADEKSAHKLKLKIENCTKADEVMSVVEFIERPDTTEAGE